MVNAGRVLIIPQGDWSSLEPYQMLDLVTYDKTAYLARKASVGVNPQTDVQKVYWQPFGTAVEIATTEKPGIVMPDGTTITISQTGVIEAHLILGEAEDVDIVNPQNGQVLAYSSILDAWQNKSLGTAASKDSTSNITEDSEDLIESGAVYSLKSALEDTLDGKINTTDIANNLTTTTTGKVLDATKGKALNDNITNKHKVVRKWINASDWTIDTTSQSGSTLYKKQVTLNHIYVPMPSISISNADDSDLPRTYHQTDYDRIRYVIADDSVPCLFFFATSIPQYGCWVNIEGVD